MYNIFYDFHESYLIYKINVFISIIKYNYIVNLVIISSI